MRFFAGAFLLLGGVPLAIAAYFFLRNQVKTEYWVLGGFGLVFFTCGLLLALLPSRQEFNKDKGQMTHRRLCKVVGRPLIEGGWHTAKGQHGIRTTYFTYQLNLVLDDDLVPRVNLTNHSDWDSTWQCGQDLATFLQIPYMDHVSEEDEE
jgi:hypothetical protein